MLATTIQREFERVGRVPRVTRNDITAMALEGYRSRLANRELGQRGKLKPQLVEALLQGLTQQEAVQLANHLAHYFHVDLVKVLEGVTEDLYGPYRHSSELPLWPAAR